MSFIAIIVGIIILIKGGELLFDGSIATSLKLKIPKFIVGMTVVSFATSAPELIVSVQSAVMGHPDLALGNILGSNIANIAFVLGIIVVISPIKVNKIFYKIDWPVMMLITSIFYYFLVNDNSLSKNEGIILLIILCIYLAFLFFFKRDEIEEDILSANQNDLSFLRIFFLLGFGGFFLWLGSEVLIKGAVDVASQIGISERVISVSVVAFCTSIPELSTSIVAIINKEKGISIGNLIGSNIFDILGVMGITAILAPIDNIDQKLIQSDSVWMLSIAFLILPLVFINKKFVFGRIEGVVLIIVYIVFIGRIFL
jgi:cation:H+ antiporter